MSSIELKGLKGIKGLDSLLAETRTEKYSMEGLVTLSIEMLSSGKYQPRSHFTDELLNELAASIKSQGIIQPLIVRKSGDKRYEIIAGERRWRAAKIAGLVDVPVIVRNIPDETALAFALIENIQREDLSPIDEAIALSRLQEEFSMTHSEIADTVSRSRSAVTNLLRLLSLDADVKELLQTGQLEMGHARALLSLNKEQQCTTAKHIIEKGLSVREAEKLVNTIKLPESVPDHKQANNIDLELNRKAEQWSRNLSQRLSSTVRIQFNSRGEGKVIIQVDTAEEVEWLVERLKVD